MLPIDPEFIHDFLVDVDRGGGGEGEEVDLQLLNETNIDEQYEEEYISSEDNIESDFSDTDTSSIIHALKLIVYLVQIMYNINFIVVSHNCSE